MEKKKLIICTVIAVSILTVIGTVSYAFFNEAVNNDDRMETTVSTGTMVLTFSGDGNNINEALNFGDSITKIFTITNTGSLESVAKLQWHEIENSYMKQSLQYTLSYATSKGGTYTDIKTAKVPRTTMSTTLDLADGLKIPAGKTYYYKLTITLLHLSDVDQTQDINANFNTKFKIVVGNAKSDTYVKYVSGLELDVNKGTPDFGSIATIDEGVYSMSDDYGTSYYFRGSVENNYVKFGKWSMDTPDVYYGYMENSVGYYNPYAFSSLEECQNDSKYNQNCTLVSNAGKDMYWRIIRINGDGSVRMIYDGTQAYGNGANNVDRLAGVSVFNSAFNDAKYAGYMYGGESGVASSVKYDENDTSSAQYNLTSSVIKSYLEDWYEDNIVAGGYDYAVANNIFCNDRSTATESNTWGPYDTTLGYGTMVTVYGATYRLRDPISQNYRTPAIPTFKCAQQHDKFTQTTSEVNAGNGALKYPVGLITADELLTAGGRYWAGGDGTSVNKKFYLYKGHGLWTMSPYANSTKGHASILYLRPEGYIDSVNTKAPNGGIAPVINISADNVSKWIGLGTQTDPYRFE